jgi:hypothetical protein
MVECVLTNSQTGFSTENCHPLRVAVLFSFNLQFPCCHINYTKVQLAPEILLQGAVIHGVSMCSQG